MTARDDRASRPRSARWPLIAGLVTVATVVIATGGGALAGSASSSGVVAGHGVGSATATCKPGKTAVAGGFDAPGFNPAQGGASVARVSSERAGRRSIETDAYNFGNREGRIVSLAYCAKPEHRIRVRSNSVTVGPGGLGSVVARCRRGTQVVAGGFGTDEFVADGGPSVLTLTSMRVGKRKWKVLGVNVPGDDGQNGGPQQAQLPGTLTAHAYCQKDAPRIKTVTEQAPVTQTAASTLELTCPPRSKPLSGGFDGNVQLFARDVRAAGTVVSKRVTGGWSLSALAISERIAASVTGYAYCKRR